LLERYAEEVSPLKKGGAEEILRIRKICPDPNAKYKVAALSGKVCADYRDRRLKGDTKHRLVSGSTVMGKHESGVRRKRPQSEHPALSERRPVIERERSVSTAADITRCRHDYGSGQVAGR